MNTNSTDTASQTLWERAKMIFLSTLMTPVEKSQAERYFGMITDVSTEGNTFKFLTMNSFAADLLQRDYAEKLKSSFILAGAQPDLTLKFKEDKEAKHALATPPIVRPPMPAERTMAPTSSFISTLPLREEYTFEEFVRGPSNSFALAAAEGVVKSPGKTGYNPLFIHGGTGLGKTHLMQAIGNRLRKENPSLAICYITAETFLNEYINAMKNNNLHEFRQKYRSIDVLLLDDVQFFQRGKDVQEEFFNTFNALRDKKKQIVMTSDVAPKNLPSIEARLTSRFEGGSVQEIESPSYETRLAILRRKAENSDNRVPDNALEFIADKIESHVRAMEGALAKVNIYLSATNSTRISKEELERLMKDLIEKEQTVRNITIKEIQLACAKKYGVSMDDILSHERNQSVVTPRQIAMFISRKCTTKSLQEIADAFGKKHATILNGVRTITERLTNEMALKCDLEDILGEFGYKLSDLTE